MDNMVDISQEQLLNVQERNFMEEDESESPGTRRVPGSPNLQIQIDQSSNDQKSSGKTNEFRDTLKKLKIKDGLSKNVSPNVSINSINKDSAKNPFKSVKSASGSLMSGISPKFKGKKPEL